MNECYLGVYIGSISTKGVIIDERNNIIASSYIWTEGNPTKAVKKLLSQDIAQKKLMSQSKLINMYYEVKYKSNDAIKSNTKILEDIREKHEDLGAEEDNKPG